MSEKGHQNQEPGSIRADQAAGPPAGGIPESIRQAQAGDRAAFDALYHAHVGRVYALCLRMTGRVDEAERLTQDAFVRLWRRIGSFRGESEFSSWLHRLTVNVVLEDSRSTKRRTSRVDAVEDPTFFELGHAAEADQTESRMELERAISELPPGARQALVLHDVEGYKHEEIAKLMGIAVGTVKAQVHRARQLLRAKLTR